MKKLKNLSFSLLILLLTTACEDKEDIIKHEAPIHPIKNGYSWTYDDIRYSGEYKDSTISEFKIQYFYTIDGIGGFSPFENKTSDKVSLINNDESGNFIQLFFNKGKLAYKSIFYKKSAQKGESWTAKNAVYISDDYSNFEIEEIEITCVNKDTIIKTPLGNFNCIGYSYHPGGEQLNGDPNHTIINYLSENIGIVKTIHYEHDNKKKWLFREKILKDYSFK